MKHKPEQFTRLNTHLKVSEVRNETDEIMSKNIFQF